MAQYVNFCYQPAIYISRILPGHANVDFIISVVNNYNLGMVSNIEIKPSPSSYEDHVATLYYAVVYFNYWNIENTIDFRSTLMQGKFAKLYYNISNFWKVTAYKGHYMQQPQMQNYAMSTSQIAPGLHQVGCSSGHNVYPPRPKLQRQQCHEYSDFDAFYHKLQVAEFWHQQKNGTGGSLSEDAGADDDEYSDEEGELEEDSSIMDDALDAFTEQILKEKREKWDFKLHNGYRMFDFNSAAY